MTRFLVLAFASFASACIATNPPTTHPGETAMQTTTQPVPAPTAVAVLRFRVESFEAWKPSFDEFAAARRRAGILSAHVNRATDDPNGVTVCLSATSFVALEAFLDSPERAVAMKRAGVLGTPATTLLVPVEDRTIKDRPLAGAIVRHRVSDFDAWKRGFDARASVRAQAGVVGHAVDRAKDDPSQVVVYLQAESADVLRRFTDSEDLRAAMTKSGVQGAPEIAFVQGFAFGR